MPFLVKIKEKKDKSGSTSFRFIIPPAVIRKLGLGHKDSITVWIEGVFREAKQVEADPIKVEMPAEIFKPSKSSLGVTVTKTYVETYRFKDGDKLLIEITLDVKAEELEGE